MMTASSPSRRWYLAGEFIITGETQEEAERALDALERAGKRAAASVDIYVHADESTTDA